MPNHRIEPGEVTRKHMVSMTRRAESELADIQAETGLSMSAIIRCLIAKEWRRLARLARKRKLDEGRKD